MEAGKRRVSKDLRPVFDHLSAIVPKKEADRLASEGRWREIPGIIAWGHYRELLKRPFDRLAKVYEAGAEIGVSKINGAFAARRRAVHFRKGIPVLDELFDKDVRPRFNFDRFSDSTQASLRAAQDDLIQQLELDARDTIEAVVISGQLTGLAPDQIVDDIRDMIGLTDTQAQAVLNYRSMLEDLDSDALRRQLRNTDMDVTFQDAIDSGTDLPDDVIDEMTDDYRDNYLDYRADTIAQTESVRAANEGLHDAYSQAVDRGALPEDAVKREWELGDTPCPICESIPDNNPDGIGLDESFDSDDGPVDDPPVHPNCMCSVNYVTDLSQVDDDEEAFKAFDPNQDRDERGRWEGGGGSAHHNEPAGAGRSPGVVSHDLATTDAVKAEWSKSAPNTADAVSHAAGDAQKSLASVGEHLATQEGVGFKNPGMKSRESLDRKLAGGRAPENVTDAVRVGFDVKTPGEADKIISELGKHFAVADEGWQKTPAGYFDRKAMVRFASGIVGEVQFWPPGMLEAKDGAGGGHKLYEAARGMANGSAEKVKLEEKMQALYGSALSQLGSAWDAPLGRSGK